MKRLSQGEYAVIFLLLIASLFAGVIIARTLITNADATMSVFLFRLPIYSHDILLADWHTNILKIPFLIIQASLPFNLRAFEFFSTFYIFSMSLGWSLVTGIVLGRKYFIPTSIFLAFLTVGSLALSNETAFATIRNIEYPLFFISLYLFWKAFEFAGESAKKRLGSYRLYGLLYVLITTVLGASDPFFLYIGLPAIILQLAYYAFYKIHRPKIIFIGAAVVVASFILSKLFIFFAMKLGVFHYYGEDLKSIVYNLRDLPVHAWDTVLVLVRLYGADISNATISLGSSGRVFMLMILMWSVYFYILRIKKLKHIINSNKTYASILLSSMVALGYYLFLAGFDMQYRYLVIVALVLPIPLVEFLNEKNILKYFFQKHSKITACIVVVAILSLGLLSFKEYTSSNYSRDKANITNVSAIASQISRQGINTVIAGHSYSSSVAYWAKEDLHYIPILFCNQNLPFLSRESWYDPEWKVSQNIAVIVDRTGRDANSWQCGEKELLAYYGQPLNTQVVPALDGKTVTILVYPKSTVSKIKFIDTKGIPSPSL